ncbi:MAG TPA: ATP-binding protein [Xanthobacteraceae bacterium]|nr:ATP-binding protein [Xanthobacteraceae bacterium]
MSENNAILNIKPLQTDAALGHVNSITGSQAIARFPIEGLSSGNCAAITVGRFVKIRSHAALIIGIITDIAMERPTEAAESGTATARVDLLGQIERSMAGTIRFKRGVVDYPTIGEAVMPLSKEELRAVFQSAETNAIEIGNLHQDNTVTACVDVDELLSKHFAVLGTTGVGKSSAVVLILQQVLHTRPNLRIFMLDAHNEYGRCFGDRAQVMTPSNLKLPFWLFNFEEIVDVFFSGRPAVAEEVEILAEVIPLAKAAYTQYKAVERLALKKLDAKNVGYTVDTPVPYRLADLLNLIDERMGKLENRSSRMNYHKLMTRIETVSNDPRYSFMFENANVGGDTMAEAISQLFRLPSNGKPMTIMQLAGFPAEVVDAVVSVLSRIAFDFGLWSDGAAPLLFVCEEAHRYASADHSNGFAPTRRAIARIAKEGRKYGVFLGLITQRPAELDPTIISQCSTLFAMRMSNDRDQALLRSAVSDTAANLLAFVPSLGTREALAFGVGVPLPTRFRFSELPIDFIPRSEALAGKSDFDASGQDLNFIASVVERWRGATISQRKAGEEPLRELRAGLSPAAPPAQSAQPPEQRFSLLRKPLSDRPEPMEPLLRSPPPGQPFR